jgi:hypothetical protein
MATSNTQIELLKNQREQNLVTIKTNREQQTIHASEMFKLELANVAIDTQLKSLLVVKMTVDILDRLFEYDKLSNKPECGYIQKCEDYLDDNRHVNGSAFNSFTNFKALKTYIINNPSSSKNEAYLDDAKIFLKYVEELLTRSHNKHNNVLAQSTYIEPPKNMPCPSCIGIKYGNESCELFGIEEKQCIIKKSSFDGIYYVASGCRHKMKYGVSFGSTLLNIMSIDATEPICEFFDTNNVYI